MKWFIHSQTLTVIPLKFGKAYDKLFHPTLYNGCNYLSIFGFKSNHVSERVSRHLIDHTGFRLPGPLIMQYLETHVQFPSWWRHPMETFSLLLAFCVLNSPITGEFPHKGQWHEALMCSLICALENDQTVEGAWRRHRGYYDVTVMWRLWMSFSEVKMCLRTDLFDLISFRSSNIKTLVYRSPNATNVRYIDDLGRNAVCSMWKIIFAVNFPVRYISDIRRALDCS